MLRNLLKLIAYSCPRLAARRVTERGFARLTFAKHVDTALRKAGLFLMSYGPEAISVYVSPGSGMLLALTPLAASCHLITYQEAV